MSRIRIVIVVVWAAVVLTAPGCVTGGRVAGAEERLYNRHGYQAHQNFSEERYDATIAELEIQNAMAPENTEPLFGLACVYARKGDKEAALDWLDKARAAGFTDYERALRNEHLASLAGEDRFKSITGKMEDASKALEPMWRTLHKDLDPALAPAYPSLSALEKEFAARARKLDDEMWRQNSLIALRAHWGLLDEKAAALRRYAADHPNARDRERAGLDLVETMGSYRNPYWETPWDEDGQAAAEACDWFLRTFPDSRQAPRVFFMRAVARALSFHPPERGEKLFRPEVAEVATREFDAVVARYPRSFEAGKALVWHAAIALDAADDNLTPEVEQIHTRFMSEYRHNGPVMTFARQWAPGFLSRFVTLEGFEGTDLSGKEWNLAAMKGKVVLIDFWATWCSPCVAEMPTLEKAYAKYKDQGFEIVGVSLDEDRLALVKYLARHRISWPQIHEGNGFGATLARRFNVRGIPFTILVDRDGRIAATDLRGPQTIEKIGKVVGRAPSTPTSGGSAR